MLRNARLTTITADIVSAFAANNKLNPVDVLGLITSVHGALTGLGKTATEVAAPAPVPAVSVKKSVTNDAITCLECGLTFKSLKRHLATSHGMAPSDYRAKWELPATYPMVAPGYAEQRSQMAKEIGLGQKGRRAKSQKAAPAAEAPKRGRKPKKA